MENSNPATLSLVTNKNYDKDASLSNSFIESEKWYLDDTLNGNWRLEDEFDNDKLLTLRKNVTSSHASIPQGEVSILFEPKIPSYFKVITTKKLDSLSQETVKCEISGDAEIKKDNEIGSCKDFEDKYMIPGTVWCQLVLGIGIWNGKRATISGCSENGNIFLQLRRNVMPLVLNK